MFDALNSFFRWISMALLLLFCVVFSLVTNVLDILMAVLSSPPLLVFVLIGSVGVVFAGRQYSKYQKSYFEKHRERKR